MVRWLYRRRAMLDSFVMRAWRRWYRRWGYRLRVLGSFPTLWRQFCSNCGTRRWQAGNDEWYGLCMGCLDGYSRAALLEWGPGRGRMHESQGKLHRRLLAAARSGGGGEGNSGVVGQNRPRPDHRTSTSHPPTAKPPKGTKRRSLPDLLGSKRSPAKIPRSKKTGQKDRWSL